MIKHNGPVPYFYIYYGFFLNFLTKVDMFSMLDLYIKIQCLCWLDTVPYLTNIIVQATVASKPI